MEQNIYFNYIQVKNTCTHENHKHRFSQCMYMKITHTKLVKDTILSVHTVGGLN